jgi:diaminopimelate epimerase
MLAEPKTTTSYSFYKMNGLDNDFIIIDNRLHNYNFLYPQINQICQKLCHRKNIGCDQLIILNNSQIADVAIDIFNSDGSKSGACGNATRCIASLIFVEKQSENITIAIGQKILPCTKIDHQNIAVNMGQASILHQNLVFHQLNFMALDVGNPHAVCFIDKPLSDNLFYTIGPDVENNLEYFPNKTNVEFAQVLNCHTIAVRVWERGVGETSACGSGACAVVVASILQNLVDNTEITVIFAGGKLKISWQNRQNIIMIGGYQKIFTGFFDSNFLINS